MAMNNKKSAHRCLPLLPQHLQRWRAAVPQPIGRLEHLQQYALAGSFTLGRLEAYLPERFFDWYACGSELWRCANDFFLQSVAQLVEQRTEWSQQWERAVAYARFGVYFDYRVHRNSLSEFQRGQRRKHLSMMSFSDAVWILANCWMLGWRAAGIDLYRIIIRAIEDHLFNDAGTFGTRRAHYFCLRLISYHLGDQASRDWPAFASDEPIYETLLMNWKAEDPAALEMPILAACDRHTHHSGPDTTKVFRDFNAYPQMYQPFEILLLFRLRQWRGLALPLVDHPLLATPLGQLGDEVPEYSDELLRGVVARAEQERPKD